MSLQDVQLSMIHFISDNIKDLNGNVVWVYKGVSLPKNTPFCTVENVEHTVRKMDKLNEYEENLFSFRIGIYADTHIRLLKLLEEVKTNLQQKKVPMHGNSSVYFQVDVTNKTSDIDDENDAIQSHRMYLDAMVSIFNKI